LSKVILSINKGDGLRLYGPLTLRVLKGQVSLLGAELSSNDIIDIKSLRSYSVLAVEDSELEVNVKEGGRVEFPVKEEHYMSWLRLADTILDSIESHSTIAVLGPVESGKTSYAALLANRAISRGVAPSVIDADIGQADIGPPGFVSLSYPGSWITWLRELEPVVMKFVGSIEPGPVMGKLISSVKILVEKSRKDGLGITIIDTDGWVQGLQAVEAKIDMLDSVGVDMAVVLGDEILYNVLRKALEAPVYYLPSPEVKIVRGVGERRLLRKENYRRFLEGFEREIDLEKVTVKGSCLFNGIFREDGGLKKTVLETLGSKVLAISEMPGFLCIAIESKEPPDQQNIRNLQKKVNKDVIVIHTGGTIRILSSLRDPEGFDHPALLTELDISEKKAIFRTKYDGEVREVIFSRIRLNESFEEIRGRIWI